MFIIEFPWPDPVLSPNARVHWRGKMSPKADAREDGRLCAYQAVDDFDGDHSYHIHPETRLEAFWQFCPPDRRKRDTGNLLASMKSYLDGACDTLGIDDAQIKREHIEFGEVDRGRGTVKLGLLVYNHRVPSMFEIADDWIRQKGVK